MQTIVSSKGQTVIPETIREQARINSGDTLEVGYLNGLVIMRKTVPLSTAQARDLIVSGRALPEQSAADEATVASTLKTVRTRRA